ncbi:UDP-N-acetylmuramoyl-L-alanine--D-glutamate ligase [candidate division KSB1 bacterium]|nr:UDP-N-acetylmuramoyl-L-alanine--D-glutamate ligase [candidate division KSB1 bacterium]NIR72011.1 UDP-N-acetylmuramoyl-L-alanine--D-glutamate ligase [candidate division KSB1 bacterium]NIS24590.1 UDP-N-acetylmuramoyl-L-alanine--D-glutamate ligase [candidate division KSB1 bacterium]NIT71498.1 UDP-N-acetylmuramoyl-L-alanine--D-glutamate ligase [candidate division KSB1 bacterium]NIU24143.1 UDP-N-acetylmuramoyl-L-alanine--D-glutamate ligase [candidate division KSB1 bacterium]
MTDFLPKNSVVSVLGAGRSGLAAANLLIKKGHPVFVSDIQKSELKQREIKFLKERGIECEFGRHSSKVLEADLMVVSPGISLEIEIIKKALSLRIPVASELEVAYWFCPGPIVAVTGTNGKSTTTALIGEMFKAAARDHVVAGNIGHAFSSTVLNMTPETTAIVEVSSFQLELIRRFSPHISILLNLAPDHLDRHQNFNDYVAAKLRIFENQTPTDFAIYNAEDPSTCQALDSLNLRAKTFPFHAELRLNNGCYIRQDFVEARLDDTTHSILGINDLTLPGKHNRSNALASALAALLADIPIAGISEALKRFKGLEHRLEFVRSIDGVMFIDDSKATNLDSMLKALHSVEQPLILIAGGKDKGEDYSRLNKSISQKVKKLILMGESASKMADALRNGIDKVHVANLEQAINEARAVAVPGDAILFSPGCASFDMFANYEDRGRQFKTLVNGIE